MKYFNLFSGAVTLLVTLLMASCDTFSAPSDPDKNMEQVKDVSGTWQLSTVSRNGTDITDVMDFSQFKIDLKRNGDYTIENYLPFVVRQDGKWKVDDIYFPFHLYFTENGATEQSVTEIQFPISNGERTIVITHSPGCVKNTYTYVFKKISEN